MQLPCRSGLESPHSQVNGKRSKRCLIEISRYRFSLVISGLTKILQRVNELTPSTSGQRPFHTMDQDRQESIIIVLETLEKCLANTPKDTTKFEEATNVKLLLREICQFISERDNVITGVIRRENHNTANIRKINRNRSNRHVGLGNNPCLFQAYRTIIHRPK